MLEKIHSRPAAITFGVVATMAALTALSTKIIGGMRQIPAWTNQLYNVSFIAVTPLFIAAMVTGCKLKKEEKVEEKVRIADNAMNDLLDKYDLAVNLWTVGNAGKLTVEQGNTLLAPFRSHDSPLSEMVNNRRERCRVLLKSLFRHGREDLATDKQRQDLQTLIFDYQKA